MIRKRAFLGCSGGATAVEFGLIAPVLFLLILGIIELGLIFFTNVVLQGAASAASRIGKTGFSPGNPDDPPQTRRDQYIRAKVEELSFGLLDGKKLQLRVVWYPGYANVGQPEPCLVAVCTNTSPPEDYQDINANGQWDADASSPGPGAGGATALYELRYPWPLFSPLIGKFFGEEAVTVTATAVVRNEPF